MLHESGCKPNKTLVHKGSKFYNRSMKSRLQNNNIDMYSTQNKGVFFIAERLNKIKYMND